SVGAVSPAGRRGAVHSTEGTVSLMLAAITTAQRWFENSCAGAGYTLELFIRALGQLVMLGRKRRETVQQLSLCTLGSLPVVFITALFTGMIVSLQTGQVLRD